MNTLVKNTRFPKALVGAISVLGLVACSGDANYDFDSSVNAAKAKVALTPTFDPAAGELPYPNNLLFLGSTDGTLNIPLADDVDAEDYSNPQVALNSLDGFSTIEAITSDFGSTIDGELEKQIDPATLVIGETVRVFEVSNDPLTTAITGIVRELDATEIYPAVAANGTTLAIQPLTPLKESTTYMVLLLDGIADTNGVASRRGTVFGLTADATSLTDSPAAALEPVRLLTLAMLGQAETQNIAADSVLLAWNFTTQSITPVLQAVKDSTVAQSITVQASGLDTSAIGGSGAADILVGTIQIPNYLETPTETNLLLPLQTFWTGEAGSHLTRFNPNPLLKSMQTIPVLMTQPKTAAPEGGWPIAIFQHGITRNRSDMLAIADTMAGAGFAVIAIDLPMHGITDTESALRQANLERTFDLDLRNNETRNPEPDGIIDDSGSYFYNLQNLLNTRSNMSQAVSDLFTLSASVNFLPNINPSRKAFVGLSLGSIVGATFLAYDDSMQSATLASPGGGVSRLLAYSPAFGPAISAGLAAVGIDLDSANGQAFLTAAQTTADSADPINHAKKITGNVHVHLTHMLEDTVVTGSVQGAPLSGTVSLAKTMGLPIVATTTQGDGWVKFKTGAHAALITPGDDNVDLAVTTELQTQMAVFAATGGATIQVTDESLLEGETTE